MNCYDISQTDGEPLPEMACVHGNPQHHAEALRTFVAGKGIGLEYSDDLAGALGASCGERILLRKGLSPAEEFSTLVHEVAHELLHRGERKGALPKTARETEAEAVAFVVCQAIGLDTNTAASDYIQIYAGNKETLAESLCYIQQVAAEIIAAITAKEESGEEAPLAQAA